MKCCRTTGRNERLEGGDGWTDWMDRGGNSRGLACGVITRTNRSIWGDLVLGLVGALVAGIVTDGLVDGDAGLISSIIVAAVFAAILVLIKNLIMNRRIG